MRCRPYEVTWTMMLRRYTLLLVGNIYMHCAICVPQSALQSNVKKDSVYVLVTAQVVPEPMLCLQNIQATSFITWAQLVQKWRVNNSMETQLSYQLCPSPWRHVPVILSTFFPLPLIYLIHQGVFQESKHTIKPPLTWPCVPHLNRVLGYGEHPVHVLNLFGDYVGFSYIGGEVMLL